MTSTKTDHLAWLCEWFQSRCNGDWEHEYAIKISTNGNPGWYLQIDLVGTGLETREMGEMQDLSKQDDWYTCENNEGKFMAACSRQNLPKIVGCFREWAGK